MSEPIPHPSLREQLEQRIAAQQQVLSEGQPDPQKIAIEMELCRRDPVWWIQRWVWTYDPREDQKTRPFCLFPYQSEFIRWLQEREKTKTGGVVPKSRDTGASFIACAYGIHAFLFRPGVKVGFGSFKENKVDCRGDMGSLFEKMRFILRYLKPWMLPEGWDWRRDDNYMRLINPANNNALTGEVGVNMGQADRTSLYVVDESAYLDRPQEVEASLSATTEVRIDISTVNGPGTPFSQKWHSGTFPVFEMTYKKDPRKTPEWVKKKKAELDPVTWASQYEMDDTAAIEGICIPAKWVRAAVGINLHKLYAEKSGMIYEGVDEIQTPLIVGFDVAEEGKDETVLIPRRGPVTLAPISLGNCNTTETAMRAREVLMKLGASQVNYDVGGPGMGVKGTWQSSEKVLPFRIVAVNNGASPSPYIRWPDGQTSQEKFRNLRVESWWRLRCRFEKTYEFVENGVMHPLDEMISIPDHRKLIGQLSTCLIEYTDTGKMQLESKKDMRKRGVASPDYGDALALAYWWQPRMKAQVGVMVV